MIDSGRGMRIESGNRTSCYSIAVDIFLTYQYDAIKLAGRFRMMTTDSRSYDREADKQWASELYQKAKEIVSQLLSAQDKPVPFDSILKTVKAEQPSLCREDILDPWNPKQVYWIHLVASAIQSLKKTGKIEKTGAGWVCKDQHRVTPKPDSTTNPPPPPKPETHDLDIRQRLRERLLQLSPKEFENLVGQLLRTLGMEQITVTGRTADGGVDARCVVPFINVRVAVQAKKWAPQNTVGIDPVQRLIGSVVSGGYDRGIFVTTSAFTAGARETADSNGSRISLIDCDVLVDLMIQKSLGIVDIPVVRKEISSSFFDDLRM